MPKSKVRAQHRRASKSGGAREEWPWPSKCAIDRVTPAVAYYSCGGSLKAEKVAAAIVWEVASGVISGWALICRESAGSPRLRRLMNEKIEVVAGGIVRGFSRALRPCVLGGSLRGAGVGALASRVLPKVSAFVVGASLACALTVFLLRGVRGYGPVLFGLALPVVAFWGCLNVSWVG